ncbi:hypothetical protein MP228_001813 [Amoeboaphelidium protococcarum]|nr:hypothetical protein MP228_001813 [Amoeboaphelidium protococcarum]
MLNISYALCGAYTVCCYVCPSLVSSYFFNHSLVLSRRLKQSRWAALLHLALSTAYSIGMVYFTHHGIGLCCNSLSSIQCKFLLCFSAAYMLKVKVGLFYGAASGSSRSSVATVVCPSLLSSRTQLRLPLCPGAKSLQLTGADGSTHSATGFVVYDGVCCFDVYGQLATFDYLWCYVGVACGNHTYLLASITVAVTVPCLCIEYVPPEVRPVTVGPLKGALCLSSLIPRRCFWLYCTPGPCLDFWLYCTPGSSLAALCLLPLLRVCPNRGSSCYCWAAERCFVLIYSLSHGIVVGCTAHLDLASTFGCTAHLGRLLLLSVLSVSCLCSEYVPTEVRPVTVGPLKGALCLIIYSYPTALFLAVLHTWTLPRLLAVLHTWVVCLSVLSVS